MRLVYEKSGLEVQVGHKVVGPHGEVFTVEYFREPHSPASSGKITIKDFQDHTHEFYVGIIGAKWIEREDRDE